MDQRYLPGGHRPKKKEDQAEVDGWQARKASMPGGYPDDRQRAYFDGLRRGAISALQKLAVAIGTQKFSSEYQAVQDNPWRLPCCLSSLRVYKMASI